MTPRYPDITLQIVGQEGNAFAILGRAKRAAKAGGLPQTEIDAFWQEATSGDYDHLLATCTKWFKVE
jgi:hypothetical protein